MKTHFLHLNQDPFNSIKNGTKTIEMRLMDEKRQQMIVGDKIIFSNRANENEVVEAKIVKLHKFPSFKELYANFNKVCLGYSEGEVADYKDMEKYYSKEEQKLYGVVGIEIELI